ncbi:hypothetical protein IJ732_05170 [bacterium]|nr:hypothetical protein [bacterium]
MSDIKKYSKEGAVHNISQKQMEALKKIPKKTIEKLKKAENLKDQNISPDTIFNTKDNAKAIYETRKALGIKPEEIELIDKLGGIDNLFDIIDADGNGNVSYEELIETTNVDNEEWAVNTDFSLSAQDIVTIYDNAMASEDAVVTENELDGSTNYKFKDGAESTIYRDMDGNVTYNITNEPLPKGERKEALHDYINRVTNETTYDKKGRVKQQKEDHAGTLYDKKVDVKYKLGGNKVVTTTTVGRITDVEYDKKGNVVSQEEFLRNSSDGKIDTTYQKSVGECWLLAQVKSLSDTVVGQQIIKDAIKINSDGSVTVKLKGVGMEYTYPLDRVASRDYYTPGMEYSEGDIDMRFIELAIGDFRKEAMNYPVGETLQAIFPSDATENDPLDGGGLSEAIFYLTGVIPEDVYSYSDIERQLENKSQRPDSYTLVTAFKETDPSVGKFNDFNYNIVSGHEYSISRVTADTVYVVNPWDSSKEIAYPKDKFMQNCVATSSVNLDQFFPRKIYFK